MTHIVTINSTTYRWQSDNHGGGTLTTDDETPIECKTLHDAEAKLLEWGEDEQDINWVIQ